MRRRIWHIWWRRNYGRELALTQAEDIWDKVIKKSPRCVSLRRRAVAPRRMTTSDLLDATQGPHVHYEAIGPDGRIIIENSHVQITNP